MDIHTYLRQLLQEYAELNDKDIFSYEIHTKGLTILKLRDCLAALGELLEEKMENNAYVCKINAGAFLQNTAVLAAVLDDGKLYTAAYAKEGIIKQHTAQKAVERLTAYLKKENRLEKEE